MSKPNAVPPYALFEGNTGGFLIVEFPKTKLASISTVLESTAPDIASSKMSAFCFRMPPESHSACASANLERGFLLG
jgi:hypothetical protein